MQKFNIWFLSDSERNFLKPELTKIVYKSWYAILKVN